MFQQVTLIGNLGRDPEVRRTQQGTDVVTLNVATSRGVKRGDKWDNETTWHRVVAFDKAGKTVADYGKKGNQVFIQGRISIRDYNDKDGVERRAFEIVAFTCRLLERIEKGSKPAPREDGNDLDDEPSTGPDDLDDEMPF